LRKEVEKKQKKMEDGESNEKKKRERKERRQRHEKELGDDRKKRRNATEGLSFKSSN
jgi:hypothetical protein